jgi:hypothetical protein
MTTTTVEAGQPAVEVLAEALSETNTPALSLVKNDDKPAPPPYHAREVKTIAQLLALKMEAMLSDFEKETGATIWSVRRDYAGKMTVDAQFEGSIIYTSH